MAFFSGHSSIEPSSVECVPMDRDSSLFCGLCSASQINAFLAQSMDSGGWPSLGRFVVVPGSFYLMIMDLMMIWGIIKDLDFLYPNLDLNF